MRKLSITRRWLFSTLGVTVIIMLVVIFVSSKALRDYYYDTAYMTLYSRARSQSVNNFSVSILTPRTTCSAQRRAVY